MASGSTKDLPDCKPGPWDLGCLVAGLTLRSIISIWSYRFLWGYLYSTHWTRWREERRQRERERERGSRLGLGRKMPDRPVLPAFSQVELLTFTPPSRSAAILYVLCICPAAFNDTRQLQPSRTCPPTIRARVTGER